jgi:hypothetical protein
MQWVMGTSPGGRKAAGHEAGHCPLSDAVVKNSGTIPPIPNISSWHSAKLTTRKTLPSHLPFLSEGI